MNIEKQLDKITEYVVDFKSEVYKKIQLEVKKILH